MKRKLYTILACLLACSTFSSCSDWFDVSPKTDVKADKLFTTVSGFQSALAGIYISMTDEETYGGNMSFGLLDQLAQLYSVMPDGVNDVEAIYNYTEGTAWGTKSKLADMWQRSYKLIANANNLMKWLKKNGETVLLDGNNLEMMWGEAYALRAFFHFDLLRGWGPANYHSNPMAPTVKSIPYRLVADNSKQPLLTCQEVLDHIIDDLLNAKKYLAFEKDLSLSDVLSINRRYRFNYHAVNALLARVYCYMGKNEEAIACAKEVIDHCGLQLQIGNDKSPVIFDEVICGLYMDKMEDRLTSHWSDGDKLTQQYFVNRPTYYSIYEIDRYSTADIRSKIFINYPSEQKYQCTKYIKNPDRVIPLIRLPEMYYILCEMTTPVEEAAVHINKVRNKRGYPSADNEKFLTKYDRIRALNREYRKEFYAEGQYFYFLKQHTNAQMEHANSLVLTDERLVFPLPDAEKEYGWTEEEEMEEFE